AALLGGDDAAVLAAGLDPDLPHADAGPARLGIVAPTAKRLALARRAVAKGRGWHGRGDVWFRPHPLLGPAGGGRLAFVFPGLEGDFAPRTDDIAAHFGLTPLPGGDVRVGDVGRHGFGVVGVGRLLDRALRRMGVVPDAVAGHSVGEWTAMAAGGLYAPDQVDAFMAGFDPDALTVPGLTFAALGTSAAHVRAALAESWADSGIVLSHDNAPRQSMVCGPGAAVEELVRSLRARGVICQVLPFRSGFHTPMLQPYLAPIEEAAGRFRLHPPTVPVWSGTTAAPFPQAEGAVRELFVRHLLEPVRFRELTEALYAAGHRVFVQVGPGRLTSLITDTLGDRDHLTVAANAPERSGMSQLRRVAVALWAAGASVAPAVRRHTAATPSVSAAPWTAAAPSAVASGTAAITSPVSPRTAATAPARRRLPPVRLDLGGALVSLDGPVLDALRAELRSAFPAVRPAPTVRQGLSAAQPAPVTGPRAPAGHPAPGHRPGRPAVAQPVPAAGPSGAALGGLEGLAAHSPAAAELTALLRDTADTAAELIAASARRNRTATTTATAATTAPAAVAPSPRPGTLPTRPAPA
ncbi:acyltransferase domain-containing protein, partial [Streptomyces puniciscabiei]